MGIGTRLFISSMVSYSRNSRFIIILRIFLYATASTDSAAFIIGGHTGSKKISTIAEYRNNKWLEIGNLIEPKDSLSAIFNNGEYFIVGGDVNPGR